MPSNDQDKANTLRQEAETIRVLVDIGFDLNTAVTAVTSGDFKLLIG